MHKRLNGIPILNGDVMDAPVQNGIAGLDKWFSTDLALLKDRHRRPLCSTLMETTGERVYSVIWTQLVVGTFYFKCS